MQPSCILPSAWLNRNIMQVHLASCLAKQKCQADLGKKIGQTCLLFRNKVVASIQHYDKEIKHTI